MTTKPGWPVSPRTSWLVSDGWEMTRRRLLHAWRVPYTLVFTALQPLMFALLFRYVFGERSPSTVTTSTS